MDKKNEYVIRLKEALNELDIIGSNSATNFIRKAAWDAFGSIQGEIKAAERRQEINEEEMRWLLNYD